MIAEADFMVVLKMHCLIRGTKVLPRGHIRADTRLVYPDGAAISVFVEQGNPERQTGYNLSDLGRTFAKLDEFGINPFRTGRFRSIEDTVGDLGVRVVNDRFVLEFMEPKDLEKCIIDLAQACLRASCMVFNRRSSQRSQIDERVHEIVEKSGLDFESDYKFRGPYRSDVKVDYRVTGPSTKSSLLIMKGSHAQANEVLRRWFDLRTADVSDRFLTILDDQGAVEKQDDLDRLSAISSVISVSHPVMIHHFLRAA
jgi:hypothetical protein